MPKALPFSEIRDGHPVWTLEVDDPLAAQELPADLRLRRVCVPGGEIVALALRLYDVDRKPQIHHLAGPLDRPEVKAWTEALAARGAVHLVLRRNGWTSSGERRVGASPADLAGLRAPIAPGRDPEGAIRVYVEAYQTHFPRLHQPEAVWDLLDAAPRKKRAPAVLAVTLLLAAAAAGAAWWFLGR